MSRAVAFHRFLFLPTFYDKETGGLVVREFEEIFRKALGWVYNLTDNRIESDELESMVRRAADKAKSFDASKLVVKYIGGTERPLKGEMDGREIQSYVEAHISEDYGLIELAADVESDNEELIRSLYDSTKSFETPEYVKNFYLIQAVGVQPDVIHRVLGWESPQTTQFDEFDIYWSDDEFDSFAIVHKLETPNFLKTKLDFLDFYLAMLRLNETWDEYREKRNKLVNHQEEFRKRLNSFSEGGECHKAMTEDSKPTREKIEKLDKCLDSLLKVYQPARERLTGIDSSLHSLEVNFEALKLAVRRIHPDAENRNPFRELILAHEAHLKQLRSDRSRHINLLSWAEHLFGVISTEVQIERQKLEHREEERERRFSRAVGLIGAVLSALGIGEIFDYQSASAVYELLRSDSWPPFVSGDPLWDLEALAIRVAAAAFVGFGVAKILEQIAQNE